MSELATDTDAPVSTCWLLFSTRLKMVFVLTHMFEHAGHIDAYTQHGGYKDTLV